MSTWVVGNCTNILSHSWYYSRQRKEHGKKKSHSLLLSIQIGLKFLGNLLKWWDVFMLSTPNGWMDATLLSPGQLCSAAEPTAGSVQVTWILQVHRDSRLSRTGPACPPCWASSDKHIPSIARSRGAAHVSRGSEIAFLAALCWPLGSRAAELCTECVSLAYVICNENNAANVLFFILEEAHETNNN